ncbi:TetR/AcrR family transcriptional regulator [Sphingomonas sp.]|uniref:TetR/AcrR family transcriptional regulator n=1 Tax=Sphingomonas sp. TaxID=28214 RepID=UPI003B009302
MPGELEIAEPDVAPKRRAAERVSAAADRLFYERGIRAVGVEEIVATAGVTKPSLYRRYPSKDALVAACLEARFEQAMANIDAIAALTPDDPAATLRALVAHVGDEIQKEGYRGCALTNAAIEFPEPDHPTRKLALDLKCRKRTRLLAIAERVATDRPDELVDALILLLEGARAISHIAGMARSPAASLTAAADAVLAGFARRGD